MSDWYNINLAHIDSPALIIDKAKVVQNVTSAIQHAGGLTRLRPHVKTHKMLEVAQLQMDQGITKFKCATIPEAEMLGMAGATDVLIAYQPQGPKLERVLHLRQAYPQTRYSFLIDNATTATQVQQLYRPSGRAAEVYIDVNNGHDRTGIKLEFIKELVAHCAALDHVQIVGLHCYDGHIRMASLEDRVSGSTEAFKAVLKLKEVIDQEYETSLNVVAGGSPSFSVHAEYHDVECSPGTWIFWDERYQSLYQEQPFQIAAVVATRVISKIDAHTYCLDLGHKSIASEFPFPRVEFVGDHQLTQTGHSEEHLTVVSEQADALEIGQLLLAKPYHICPTVALYDHAHIVVDGKVEEQWKVIARDRKITI